MSPIPQTEPPPEGLLVVDKPIGATSFSVIRALRRALDTRAIGHTGTLDPMATGVLNICVGWAVKLIQFLDTDRKAYRAIVRLGQVSDTDDSEGRIIATTAPRVTRREIETAAETFVGPIMQRPPAFSAVRQDGERAYRKARRGESVALEPRPVRIDAIEIEAVELPDVTLRVICGRGTYIRSLARDFGDALGCGAYLWGLRRLESDGRRIDDATPLDTLIAEIEAGRPPFVSSRDMLSHIPAVELAPPSLLRLCQGQRLPVPPSLDAPRGSAVRICGDTGDRALRAVAIIEEQRNGVFCLRPKRVHPRR